MDNEEPPELAKYLARREADLFKFHPQFFYSNEEIKASSDPLKRDLTPICIPPSWDLVQKYAGASNENADGYDKALYENGRRHYVGDQGEAKFLDLMRNLEIGGILIGEVNYQHLLYGHQLSNSEKEYFMLPSQITKRLKKGGFFLIEVKQWSNTRDNAKFLKQALDQVKKQRAKLLTLCNLSSEDDAAITEEEFSDDLISMVYSNNCLYFENGTVEKNISEYFCRATQKRSQTNVLRFFYLYRNFVIFLCGYRPDIFISPVQCALQVRKNILTHSINTINFYSKKNATNIRNTAKTVDVFLTEMPFLPNKKINFGEYQTIYLTEQQMKAIGSFSGKGEFSPKKQVIFGPAGSGKTLILMIKVFILAQIRTEKKMAFMTQSSEHVKKLQHFVDQNSSTFCRKIQLKAPSRFSKVAEDSDTVFDECIQKFGERTKLMKTGDYYRIQVITGSLGNRCSVDLSSFKSDEFVVTNLDTFFRSSKQIQNFFYSIKSKTLEKIFESGHNFDGVKVEFNFVKVNVVNHVKDYEDIMKDYGALVTALERRITKLLEVEKCKPDEIGLFCSMSYHNEVRKKFPTVSIFWDSDSMKSLEFPIMIIENPELDKFFLLSSRAICHLIIFSTDASKYWKQEMLAARTKYKFMLNGSSKSQKTFVSRARPRTTATLVLKHLEEGMSPIVYSENVTTDTPL